MIIHCPNCSKILAKGFEELDMVAVDFSFRTRCAHCNADVELTVRCVRIERQVGTTKTVHTQTKGPPPADTPGRVMVE